MSVAVKSTTTAVKDAATKRKSAGPKVDRTEGFFKAFNITALFSSALYYAWTNVENPDNGMMFDKDPVKAFLISPPFLFGAPLGYVICVLLLSRLMTNRPPLTNFLRTYVQPAYNVAQIVLCSYMVWGLWPQVDIKGGNPFGLNTKRDASIEYFVYLHYLSKFLDWSDTAFMILKKNYRQVSFLQVFHHATIGVVWGSLLQFGWGSGTAAYGAFINSVTHVLLYTHYFITSYGINNPFKRYITKFQLAQFASCIVHAALVLAYEEVYPQDLSYLQVAYHVIMLYLFGFQMQWAPVWCTGAQDLDVTDAKKIE